MNKLNINELSIETLLSPFILVREFGLEPRMILNPACEKKIKWFLPYKGKGNFVRVKKTDDGCQIASMRQSKGDIPYYQLCFSSDPHQVLLEQYETGDRDPDKKWIDYRKARITLHNDSLIVDSISANFFDREVGPIRNITLVRDTYDQYGILDIEKSMSVKDESLPSFSVDQMSYQEVIKILSRYEHLFSQKFATVSSFPYVAPKSYQVVRHPGFVEKAYLMTMEESRHISAQIVPLYSANGYNYLYDMDYNFIVQSLKDREETGTFLPELSKKEIDAIIKNEFQSEITINAMRERFQKRLTLK